MKKKGFLPDKSSLICKEKEKFSSQKKREKDEKERENKERKRDFIKDFEPKEK